ncbi:MAG: MATE family efflux transporter [Bacteroidales bacterium]|nr:MATE family efflux transporter [Bacteroidales bacterium]
MSASLPKGGSSSRLSDEKRLYALSHGPIGRLIWDYSLPAVVGMVVMSIYNVIDRIFIGQGVGPEAIAGLAITFPVMNISAALGVLIGAGGAARMSIMLGAGDHASAQRVLGNTLVLILINATLYLTVFAIFLDPILRAFGASAASLPYARDFMLYILPGMLVMNISFTFNNLMRASGYPARAMVTMIIGAGVNIILAPIFIFWLGWGIKGAAIATDISMTFSAIFVMSHFFNKKSVVHFTPGIYRLKASIVWGILSIGAAPSVVNIASCFINVIINRTLYEYGSDNAVAAAGIFTTYTSMLTSVVVGLCQGVQPIMGFNYGAGLYGRLRRAFWIASCWALIVTTAGTLFGISCPGLVAKAFTTDGDLIAVTENALRLSLRLFWVVGFQIVSTTLFQSIGQAGKSIFLGLTRQVLFLIPLLLWLPGIWGLDGVWLSFPLSDIFATAISIVLLWWQLRQLDASQPIVSAEAIEERELS